MCSFIPSLRQPPISECRLGGSVPVGGEAEGRAVSPPAIEMIVSGAGAPDQNREDRSPHGQQNECRGGGSVRQDWGEPVPPRCSSGVHIASMRAIAGKT